MARNSVTASQTLGGGFRSTRLNVYLFFFFTGLANVPINDSACVWTLFRTEEDVQVVGRPPRLRLGARQHQRPGVPAVLQHAARQVSVYAAGRFVPFIVVLKMQDVRHFSLRPHFKKEKKQKKESSFFTLHSVASFCIYLLVAS